jgi:phage terminase large subunit GpA-like protein
MTPTVALIKELRADLAPPPRVTVSEWADSERRLSQEASAEPGRWHTDRAEFQRGIMDAVRDPSIQTVVLVSSAQIGKTECLLNSLGYAIDLDPGPALGIYPTLEMAQSFSKDRLSPMLRDTPVLRGKVQDEKTRDSTQTLLRKSFPGGHLTLAGANSPVSLASRPIRFVFADDVDRFPATVGTEDHGEGDPLQLGIKRTTTFWNRKILIASTPTVAGISRIESWYGLSDQRRYHVPCPRCSVLHVLEWKQVRWEAHDPLTAHLVCPACSGRIENHERDAMVRAGVWRPTAPFTGIAGFHIWEAYSPWVKLPEIVAKFLEANKAGRESLRVFVNTALGETWEDEATKVEAHTLLARCETYETEVPAGVCCLTAGVDTQDDRLEVVVIGWGLGEEAWIVDVRTLPGDPQRPETWVQLDAVLTGAYQHASGAKLPVLATCVDSAGHRTDDVYKYVLPRQHLRVFAIVGREGDRPIVSAPAPKRTGRNPRPVALYTVGVDVCKSLWMSRFHLVAAGPGYVHLPRGHPGVHEEFVAQLTSEKLVTKYTKGIPTRQWVQTRPRNEALDCANYALAALRLLNPRLSDMAARIAASRREEPPEPPTVERTLDTPAAPRPAPSPAPLAPRPPARRVWRSNYLAR